MQNLNYVWFNYFIARRVWNLFSHEFSEEMIDDNIFNLKTLLCELAGSRVELLFASLISTYYKLRELGLTEVNGKITFVDSEYTREEKV